MTSGYSAIFPSGIIVGKVVNFEKQHDDNFYSLEVELATDFQALNNVRIIKNYRQAEPKKIQNGRRKRMINNILRGFIYFVVLVLVQVLILNNIHFLRVATPFLYLYFILKMPVGSSRTNVVFFSFLIGLTIDAFFKYAGNACVCLYAGRFYPSLVNSVIDGKRPAGRD